MRSASFIHQGDTDGNGRLSCSEIAALMEKAKRDYPQLAEHTRYFDCEDASSSHMTTEGNWLPNWLVRYLIFRPFFTQGFKSPLCLLPRDHPQLAEHTCHLECADASSRKPDKGQLAALLAPGVLHLHMFMCTGVCYCTYVAWMRVSVAAQVNP